MRLLKRGSFPTVCLAFLLLLGPSAFAQAGALDPNFGSGGIAVGPDGLAYSAIAVQADGKILATTDATGVQGISVVRFLPSGQIDDSFGSNGVGTVPGPPDCSLWLSAPNAPMAVAIQPDGKIVLVARCFASAAMGIARLNSDGSPDATFGTDGFVDIVEGFAGPQVLVQPNGDIVVGGTGGTSPPDSRFSEGSLTRYLPDGSLDPTFGRDGVVHIRRPAFSIGRIAQGPDGTILASITEEFKRYPGHGGTTMGVARFTDRGNLDSSFGQAGVALGTFHSWTVGTGLAVQTDGGIVVAGYSLRDWTLSRFDPDGTPDITFSKDGSTGTSWARRCNPNTEYPRPGTPEGVAVQPNGKIVVVGLVIGSGSACDTNASAMLRFQPGGALDASFGTGGKVSTPGLDYGTDVRVLSTYRILVAGPGPDAHGNSALVLAQYLTS